jgi:hypothetical protein
MTRAYELLGDYAFRRSTPYDEKKTPINTPLFETLGYWFAKLSKMDWDNLLMSKSVFFEKYFEFIKSDNFDQINKHWSGQEITRLFDKIKEFIYGVKR